MNLRTSLLALGLSLAATSAFAATPAAQSTPTPMPAAAASAKPAEHAAKSDKRECLKRSKVGHCEQWAAKSAAKPAETAKH
ncbi:hypothetical protein [Pseudoxanthomonas beigongshangi]|jgi:hypothetical protein